MIAVPFTSKTVPSKTLPDTSGCPGLTLSSGEVEETINLPEDPDKRTGIISLNESFKFSVIFLSMSVCLRYSFSESSEAM